MSYAFSFTYPELPKPVNQWMGLHWRVRQKEHAKWHKIVAHMLIHMGKRPDRPLQRAKLTLVRRSSNRPDFDGLVSGFKPVIDALVKNMVLANDKHENIGVPVYLWEKAPPKKGSIEVSVEEIE